MHARAAVLATDIELLFPAQLVTVIGTLPVAESSGACTSICVGLM